MQVVAMKNLPKFVGSLYSVLGKGDPGCSCVPSALAKNPKIQCTEISSFEVIPLVK